MIEKTEMLRKVYLGVSPPPSTSTRGACSDPDMDLRLNGHLQDDIEAIVSNVFRQALTTLNDLQVVPEMVLGAGDYVVALGRLRGWEKATCDAQEAPFAHGWVLRDGRVVSFVDYIATTQLLPSAWGTAIF